MPTAGSQQPSGALAARLSGTVAGNFTLVYLLLFHPTKAVCEYIHKQAGKDKMPIF